MIGQIIQHPFFIYVVIAAVATLLILLGEYFAKRNELIRHLLKGAGLVCLGAFFLLFLSEWISPLLIIGSGLVFYVVNSTLYHVILDNIKPILKGLKPKGWGYYGNGKGSGSESVITWLNDGATWDNNPPGYIMYSLIYRGVILALGLFFIATQTIINF